MGSQNDFQVGDGVTYSIGSDRYAATVIKRTPARVEIQLDSVKAAHKGLTESQTWLATPNPNGTIIKFTRRKNGAWRPAGSGSGFLSMGRNHYCDPSF